MADNIPVESCHATLSTIDASLIAVRLAMDMMYMSRFRSMKISWRSALVPVCERGRVRGEGYEGETGGGEIAGSFGSSTSGWSEDLT
jgi:hypothetical protein